MTEGGGPNVPEESAVPTPAIPANVPAHPHHPARPVLSYRSPATSEERLITIRRIGAIEAQLAQAKLQSEGIRCFIADANLSAIHPLMMSNVQLQVVEADALRAEEILTRPPDETTEGDYADEEWRCPRCHQKAVDLLPLSMGWQRARVGCLALLLLPLILACIKWLLFNSSVNRFIDRASESFGFVWFLAVASLGFTLLILKRRKRCRACGNEWTKGEPAKDD